MDRLSSLFDFLHYIISTVTESPANTLLHFLFFVYSFWYRSLYTIYHYINNIYTSYIYRRATTLRFLNLHILSRIPVDSHTAIGYYYINYSRDTYMRSMDQVEQ